MEAFSIGFAVLLGIPLSVLAIYLFETYMPEGFYDFTFIMDTVLLFATVFLIVNSYMMRDKYD